MMSARTLDKVTDKDLDEVYKAVDALMRAGTWMFLDALIAYWESVAWRTPVDLLVAYATATLPAKSKFTALKNPSIVL